MLKWLQMFACCYMGTNVIHSLCVSASVLLIARKRCCLWVSLTLRIVYIVECHLILLLHLFRLRLLSRSISSYHLLLRAWAITLCLSFSVELAGWAFCLIGQVLTTVEFLEYHLLLWSRTTSAKLLNCYGYRHDAGLLVGFFGDLSHQSKLCCRTSVTSSSTVVCVCIM